MSGGGGAALIFTMSHLHLKAQAQNGFTQGNVDGHEIRGEEVYSFEQGAEMGKAGRLILISFGPQYILGMRLL